MSKRHQDIIDFIHQLYQTTEFISLHEPKFICNEKAYVNCKVFDYSLLGERTIIKAGSLFTGYANE